MSGRDIDEPGAWDDHGNPTRPVAEIIIEQARLGAEGVATARGGAWRASTIQSIIGLRKPSRRKRAVLPEPTRKRRESKAIA